MAEQLIVPHNIARRMRPEDRQKYGITTREENIAAYEYRTERELQDIIDTWINSQPDCYCTRSRMDKKTTIRPGTPDFTCSIAGMALYIECKLPGRKLSDAQEREIAHIRSRKGRVVVAYTLGDAQMAVRKLQSKAFLDGNGK